METLARRKDGIRVVTLAGGRKRYVVTGYDPARGGGSREIGRVDTLGEAAQLKADWEAGKRSRGRPVTTCAEWVEVWTSDPSWARPSRSTNVHNAERVRPFAQDFAGVPLGEISRPLARAWVVGGRVPAEFADLARKWAGVEEKSGTVVAPAHTGNLSAVRAMCTDAMLAGLLDGNPFTQLRVPGAKGRAQIHPLSRGEVDRLVEVAGRELGEWGRVVYSTLILTAAYTGMRPAELFGLSWDDVDFERGEIDVQFQLSADGRSRPKNKRTRVIVLPEQAASALRSLPRSRSGYVFTTRLGSTFNPRVASYYWSKVRAAFVEGLPERHWLVQRMRDADGGDDLAFYELRHFCGSFLADRGASAQDIALQLGHRDGGVLAQQVYIHVYEPNARDRLRMAYGESSHEDGQATG